MAHFEYSARKASGEQVTGSRSAVSVGDLKSILQAEGVLLSEARIARAGLFSGAGERPVKLGALLAFLREYRSLSAAGLPVTQILALLEERDDDRGLGRAVFSIHEQVRHGKSIADSMAAHPLVFDQLFQATFRVAAQTGNTDGALEQLEKFIALRHDLKRKTRKAMSYPIFLLGLLFLVLAGMMLFVLPRFATLYEDFGSDLPLATRVLMGAVRLAPIWVPVSLAAVIGIWLGAKSLTKLGPLRLAADKFRFQMPFLGRIARNIVYVQIGHMMNLMLSSGMTLPAALENTATGLENTYVSAKLGAINEDISKGKSLGEALDALELFSNSSRSLLRAGETSGELDRMFAAVSLMHERELEDQMTRLLALIEPAMMLFVGLVLGSVIVAVYLPIFGLSAVIR